MDVDLMITVGGDGTILRALQRTDAAIAGINVGVVGFLTAIDTDNLEEMLERLKNGQYTIEEHIKLKLSLNDKRLLDCANEGVIHTSHVSKMRHFEILVDEDPAMCLRADGIIVATPTGSTCYSMSVGGPIIDPGVEAFVIAPIAPFKLFARPIVVPAKSKIEIKLIKDRDCVLVLDGQEEIQVNPDDVVKFTISEKKSKFVKFGEVFYNRVWENLSL
jgi:NAD+ kinase